MNIINFYCHRLASYQACIEEVTLACQLTPFGAALRFSWAGNSFMPKHSHTVSRGNFPLLIKDVVCAMYLWKGMEMDQELYMRKYVGEI